MTEALKQQVREMVERRDTGGLRQLLSEQSERVSVGLEKKRTLLHLATLWSNSEIVRLLLAHSADPNARMEDGNTPLGRGGQ